MIATFKGFKGILGALRAVYAAEIERLADEFRPRILAGEFSGSTSPPNDEGKHLRLEEELRKHPWLRGPGARAVLACSTWPDSGFCTRDGTGGWTDSEIAAESMAHDVMARAAARGWTRRYSDANPYALKVA